MMVVHLSDADSHYRCRNQKTTTRSSVDYVCENCVFMLAPYRELISLVMTFILIVL
jgi:hypothetical protein